MFGVRVNKDVTYSGWTKKSGMIVASGINARDSSRVVDFAKVFDCKLDFVFISARLWKYLARSLSV